MDPIKHKIIFCDTCIIIDYLKSKKDIIEIFSKIGYEKLYINSIVTMELYQGAISKKELIKIKKNLKKFTLLEIEQNILSYATELMENFNLSHNLKIPDAIIAATCLIYEIILFTYNRKDFMYMPNLKLY